MAANRFEQVNEVQPDAITLSLRKSASGEVGAVIFPATASGGRLNEDKISGELPAVDAFRSAIKLANEMKVAMVVMDPEGVWKKDWDELRQWLISLKPMGGGLRWCRFPGPFGGKVKMDFGIDYAGSFFSLNCIT